MIGRFGAQLRQRREEQGIDLIAIAAQTKIKMSLLEALERDDVSHWPSGIFRRAYIRTYAQAIGLDPDAVLREFLEAYPEPAEVVTTDAIASAVESRVHTGPPTRLRYIVDSAFSSLTRFRRPQVEDAPVPVPVTAAGSAPVAPTPVAPPVEHYAAAPEANAVDELMELGEVLMTEPAVAADMAEPAPLELPDAGRELLSGYAEREPERDESPQSDQEAPEVDLPPPVESRHLAQDMMEPLAAHHGPDFTALAQVCTGFARVQDVDDLGPLLAEAARVLDAPGLILWVWDPSVDALRGALAHGYSDRVLAQLPVVGREADNATAAAFRRGQTCSTRGDAHTNGAVVVPLLTGGGCAGVLAVELPHGREQEPGVRAAATILAAMLAQLAGAPASSAADHSEVDPAFEELPGVESPVRQTAARR